MFEWIVMGLFIGVPILMLVGAFVAWIYQRRQDFSLEDLDVNSPHDAEGGSAA